VRHKDLAARIVRLTLRRPPTVHLGLALEQVRRRAIPAPGLRLLTIAAARIRRPHTIRIVPIPMAIVPTTHHRTVTAVIPRLALTTTIRPRGAPPLLVPTLRLITLAAVAAIVGAAPEAPMAVVAGEALTAVEVEAPIVAVEADRTAVVAITKFKS